MYRAVILGCCVLAAGLSRAHAEEFYGFGPAPVRNYQPIQLIFLNLPVERARALPAGAIEVHVESVESNTIVKIHNPQTEAVLKFESNRTVVGSKFGLRPGLDVGLDIPFLSRFGGFLDPFVDSVEDFFGTTNPERDDFPNNSFGAFVVRRGSTTLFASEPQTMELGDLWVSAKQEILDVPGLPVLAVRAAVKLPTGRADGVFGSGKPDIGLSLAAEHQPLWWLVLYGNLSAIYPVGPITPARLTLNPMLGQALAAEARIWRDCSLLLQQETYTSPLHGNGTRMLDGTVVELTAGANVRWGDVLFQFALVDNISPVATATDFSVMLRTAYRR